jgi:hypothetical protein
VRTTQVERRRESRAARGVVRFDARGIGLSDPIDSRHPPTIADTVADACSSRSRPLPGRPGVARSTSTGTVPPRRRRRRGTSKPLSFGNQRSRIRNRSAGTASSRLARRRAQSTAPIRLAQRTVRPSASTGSSSAIRCA